MLGVKFLVAVFALVQLSTAAVLRGRGTAACRDIIATQCAEMAASLCYSNYNRSLCCATCSRLHSGQDDCPYGDQNTNISRDGRTFTCESYVAWYGQYVCRDVRVRARCCKACASA